MLSPGSFMVTDSHRLCESLHLGPNSGVRTQALLGHLQYPYLHPLQLYVFGLFLPGLPTLEGSPSEQGLYQCDSGPVTFDAPT